MDLDFYKEGQVLELIGINPENGNPDPAVHIPFKLATKYELVSYYYKHAEVGVTTRDASSLNDIIKWYHAQGIYFQSYKW